MTAPLVLLVDDDAELGEVLQFLLEREGYRSHWVRDASVALDVIPVLNPALVVTELMLPVMGGLELIGNTPRLMAMGSSWQLLRQALDRGAHSVLHKPFTPDGFLERVGDLLSGHLRPESMAEEESEVGPKLPRIQLPSGEVRDLFLEQLACTFSVEAAFILSIVEGESRRFGSPWISAEEIALSPFGILLDSKAPVWFDDLQRHSLFADCPWLLQSQHRSFGGVPIQDGAGALCGCIALSGIAVREWSHLDSAILKWIALEWTHSGVRAGVSPGAWPVLERLLKLKSWKGEPSDLRGRDT